MQGNIIIIIRKRVKNCLYEKLHVATVSKNACNPGNWYSVIILYRLRERSLIVSAREGSKTLGWEDF
jgi:hypothetical protein